MSTDLNRGVLAPVTGEYAFTELPVTGRIPAELQGHLIRNGPNPFNGSFSGEGVTSWWPEAAMLHGIELRDGKAAYRNRWVRSSAYYRHFGGDDNLAVQSNPNVNVVAHAGETLALAEHAPAVAIDRSLQTLGAPAVSRLPWPGESAHPKLDPTSGEYLTFRADGSEPYLRYGALDEHGNVQLDCTIDLPVPVMMHDMAITRRFAIFFDLGVGYDFSMLNRGHAMPLRWLAGKTSRLVIVPRAGGVPLFVDIEPCFIQHVVNAYDQTENRIVLDAVRYPHYFLLDEATDEYSPQPLGTLHRYEINLDADRVVEKQLLASHVELPRINEALTGQPYRYAYMVTQPSDEEMRGLLRYDFECHTAQHFELPPGDQNSEPVFVARPGSAAEDDGWVLAVVYRAATHTSDLLILDAQNLSAEPLAAVHIPGRIPAGFHGAWLGN